MNAEELQIWKEVDGIFTADPRKIKTARLLATITTEEAAELTYYGSEVIHPLTIEQIDGAGIPLRLKNVMNPQGAGTIIHPSQSTSFSRELPATTETSPVHVDNTSFAKSKITFMTANGYYGPSQYRRKPTAVTVVSTEAFFKALLDFVASHANHFPPRAERKHNYPQHSIARHHIPAELSLLR